MSSPETCQAGKGHVTRPVAGRAVNFSHVRLPFGRWPSPSHGRGHSRSRLQVQGPRLGGRPGIGGPISSSHTHWHLVLGVTYCLTPAFPSPPRLRARGAVRGERRLGGGSTGCVLRPLHVHFVMFQFCAPSPCGRASVPSSCAHRECSVGGGRVPWVSTGLARPAPARPAPTAHGA